jgi:signal transduction histidine kinase
MDNTTHKLDEALATPGTRWLINIIRQLPEGVLVFDEDYQILVSNPAAMGFLRAMTDTLTTRSTSEQAGDVVGRILSERADDSPRTVEIVGPIGRTFEIRTFPLALESKHRHWMALLREMTQDRKQQRLLEQQGRLAALGQLAAGISHDFNNLLTGILGYAELLACREDIPRGAYDDADAICRLGRQAAQLVRQILDFSAQTEIRRSVVDLASSLDSMHNLLIRILPENIRLHLR